MKVMNGFVTMLCFASLLAGCGSTKAAAPNEQPAAKPAAVAQAQPAAKEAAKGQKTPITVKMGNTTWKAEMDDTPLSKEILAMMPLKMDMIHYSGREFYGSLEKVPEHGKGGTLFFENGDITYCPDNNSLAVFYAKARKDKAPLTMHVIKIGHVNENLESFDKFGSSEVMTFEVVK